MYSWTAVVLLWTSPAWITEELSSGQTAPVFYGARRSEQVLGGESWGTVSLDINRESAGNYQLTIATLDHHLYDWMDRSSFSQCTGDRCEKENEGE